MDNLGTQVGIEQVIDRLVDAHVNHAERRDAELQQELRITLRELGCSGWLVSKAVGLALQHAYIVEEVRSLAAASQEARSPAGYFHNGLRRICRQHGFAWRPAKPR